MNFYCLYEGYYECVQSRIDQLKKACDDLDVNFMQLNSLSIDYSNIPQLSEGDLLFNCARESQTLESILLAKEVTTFYIVNPELNQTTSTSDWSILHDKAGIQSPKTVYHLTSDRALLKKYVDYLGGYPLIIKVTGGTRGIGTIKIESWQNLISTIDYLVTTGDKFILRQFINAKSGCRMIVLGDKVIAAADFLMNENDFRNAVIVSEIKYYKREYSEELKEIAVSATHIANTEFSGVDFLEDEDGNFYLLEINFPTGYNGLIDICGVDIPKKMVEYLIQKSNRYKS